MRRQILIILGILLLVPAAHATFGGGGGGGTGGMMPGDAEQRGGRVDAYVVPWKELKAGEAPLSTPLVLYWFPASSDDTTSGDLVSSRMLTMASARCVGMQLVRPEDAATIARWGVAGKTPVALLVATDAAVGAPGRAPGTAEVPGAPPRASTTDGKVVGRTDSEKGYLRSSGVENMVNHELYVRGSALDAQLAAAKKKAESGDKEAAIAEYQKVWEQRCVAPEQGRQAQKALRRLGVTVKDAQLR